MFCDSSYHSLDPKNRVFVPKRFQEELGRDAEGNMVAYLTPGFEGCVFLFSKEGFARVLARLDTETFRGPEARMMQRLFFGDVKPTVVDASGRLLLPDKLRQHAGIDREVAMVGVAERAEIWAKERWDAIQAQAPSMFDRLDRVLCGPPGAAS